MSWPVPRKNKNSAPVPCAVPGHFYGEEGSGMVILLAGATHTGKTRMAQKLLERYQLIDRAYPEELDL